VAGSCSFAQELKRKIGKFLKENLKLELSEEKTLITNATKKAHFLGTDIQRIASVKGEIKRFKNSRNHPQRVPPFALRLTAPLRKLVQKYKDKYMVE